MVFYFIVDEMFITIRFFIFIFQITYSESVLFKRN